MALEPLRVGRPIDVLSMNRFWTKVWQDNPGNAGATFEMKFARMWHHDAVVVNGAALETNNFASDIVGVFPYHRWWRQLPAAINDSFENYFTLDAGTYDFIVLCRTSSGDSGIVSWQVDGVAIGSTNLRTDTPAEYDIRRIDDVTIPTSGNHTLTGTVASKDGGSSNYLARIYKYHFREP